MLRPYIWYITFHACSMLSWAHAYSIFSSSCRVAWFSMVPLLLVCVNWMNCMFLLTIGQIRFRNGYVHRSSMLFSKHISLCFLIFILKHICVAATQSYVVATQIQNCWVQPQNCVKCQSEKVKIFCDEFELLLFGKRDINFGSYVLENKYFNECEQTITEILQNHAWSMNGKRSLDRDIRLL